jgi:hypothetical protein
MKSKEEYKQLILQYVNAVNPYPVDRERSQRELYNEGLLIGYMSKLFQDKPEEWIYFKRHCERIVRAREHESKE